MTNSSAHNLEALREIGERLKRKRLERGLDRHDVVERLRIRYRLIEAIEEGDLSQLPGAVYVQGFIRSYAELVGDNPDTLTGMLSQTPAPHEETERLVFPEPKKESQTPSGAYLIAGLVVCGVLLVGWSLLSQFGGGGRNAQLQNPPALDARENSRTSREAGQNRLAAPEAEETIGEPPSVSSVLSHDEFSEGIEEVKKQVVVGAQDDASPEIEADILEAPSRPDPVGFLATASEAAPPPLTLNDSGGDPALARIVLRGEETSWIELVDAEREEIVWAGHLESGDVFYIPTGRQLLLTLGNAGGVAIEADGISVETMGPSGSVRRNILLAPEALRSGSARILGREIAASLPEFERPGALFQDEAQNIAQ